MSKIVAEPSFQGYKLTYDLHTHTIFSHGKGRIRDNVMAAIDEGLIAIAITDHGPGHITYGIKKSEIPKMQQEIANLREEFKNIKIYLGVEANIISTGNYLDVPKDEFGNYDFVIAGYHYGVKNGYCLKNYFANKVNLGQSSKSQMVKNTDMTVQALYENDIKILTHPGDKGAFDILALAKACVHTNTLMEISTWHNHLTVEELKLCKHTEVKFIISSDAHKPERVGDARIAIERAFLAGIEPERIVNIEKI